MCRNIKRLRRAGETTADAEIRDAALQFVRKVSGYRKPSRANEAAFEAAVSEVTDVVRSLLSSLHSAGAAVPADDAARAR